jgi:FAD/FMN-containing dehydrogenase
MNVQAKDVAMLGEATIADLRQALRGQLVAPGDPDYDEARAIWNAAHDRRPALIARCTGAADVMRAVEFARSQDLPLAVRGGSHSIPGFSTCDGGVVIDLSRMKGIRVDRGRRTARAEGGVTWGDLDHETQAFGLATTGGLVSTTGVAGFTLGGGVGWLMRKHGLACDNLIAADVVTADGQLVAASETENPELLWGLRGGGGNFGVVTSLELKVHEVGPAITAAIVFYPGERAADVLRFYREFVRDLPDELTTLVNLFTAPPAPFLPAAWHGKRLVGLLGMHCGPADQARRAVQPMRELGGAVADLTGPMPYTAMQSLIDPLWGRGAFSYMKAGYVRELSDAAIDALVRHHAEVTSPKSEIHVHHVGGAVARVPAASSAYGERGAPFILNALASAFTGDGFATHIEWAQSLYRAMEPALTGGAYINFLSSEGQDRVRAAYGEKYDRLVGLKDRFDPTNLFALNQNIAPSAARRAEAARSTTSSTGGRP